MDKVLIYAMSVNIGGVEEYVLNLSRYNADKVCEYEYVIDGMSSPYENEMKALGVKYHFIPAKKNILSNMKALNKLFKEKRSECDTIYFNTSGIYYPVPYMLAIKYKYRIIIHSHSAGASGLRVFIHKLNRTWIMPSCSKMLACSTPAAKWLFGEKNLNRVTIIPNAINVDRFKYNPVIRKQIRTKLGIDDCFVIGHVGRLTQVKNQTFLLDLLVEAVNQGLNYKLLLVGDGEDEQLLKQKADQLGISDKVVFYGQSKKPENLMNCMDCFVMPSLLEGFPVTLVEAQANGLPCVVSDSITTEVNVSRNIRFVSLNEPVDTWHKEVMSCIGNRYNSKIELSDSGYDVHGFGKRVGELLCTNTGEKR